MNFSKLSRYYKNLVNEIMKNGQTFEDQDVRTISLSLKKIATVSLEVTDMEEIVENVFLHFMFLSKYTEQSEAVSHPQQYALRWSLGAVVFLVQSTQILHYLPKEFFKNMNFVLCVETTQSLYKKELIRVYSYFMSIIPNEISHKVSVNDKMLSELYNIIKSTCDIETQALILEVVFKLFTGSGVALVTREFLQVAEFINIESINEQTVYQNIRMVLEMLNRDSEKIFSICCTTIEVDSSRILEFSEAATTDDIWLDFDIPKEKMSFFCNTNYLNSIHKLSFESYTSWEVLSFYVKDIYNVTFAFDDLTQNLKISIRIKISNFGLFANLTFGTMRSLEISISRYAERFEKLVQVILPKFFGSSFSSKSLNIPLQPGNNDSSLTPDIDLDSGNEDLSSAQVITISDDEDEEVPSFEPTTLQEGKKNTVDTLVHQEKKKCNPGAENAEAAKRDNSNLLPKTGGEKATTRTSQLDKSDKSLEVDLNSSQASQASAHGKLSRGVSPVKKNNLNNSVENRSFKISVDTSKIDLAECLNSSVPKRSAITKVNDDNERIITSKVSKLRTPDENSFDKSLSPDLNLSMENEVNNNHEPLVGQFGKISQSDGIHLFNRSITPFSLSELHDDEDRPPSRIEKDGKISTENEKLMGKAPPTKKVKSGIKISSSLCTPIAHEKKAKSKKKINKKTELKRSVVEQRRSPSLTVVEDVMNISLHRVKNWLEEVPDNCPAVEENSTRADPNSRDPSMPSVGIRNSERSSNMAPEQIMEILMGSAEENGAQPDRAIEIAVEVPANKTVKDLLDILDSQNSKKKHEDEQMEPKHPLGGSFFSDDSNIPLARLAERMKNKGNAGKKIIKHADFPPRNNIEKDENLKSNSFSPAKVMRRRASSAFSRNNDDDSDDQVPEGNETAKKKSFDGICEDQASAYEDGTRGGNDLSKEDHKDVSGVLGAISDDHLVPVQASSPKKRKLYNPDDLSYLEKTLTKEYMRSSSPKFFNSTSGNVNIIPSFKQRQSRTEKTFKKTKSAFTSTPKKSEAVLKSTTVKKNRNQSDLEFDKLRPSVSRKVDESKVLNSSSVVNIRSKTIGKISKKSKATKSSKMPKPVLELTKKDIMGDKKDSVLEKTHSSSNFSNILQSLKDKMRDHKKEMKKRKKITGQCHSSSSSSMEPFGVALYNMRSQRKSTSKESFKQPKKVKENENNNSKQIHVLSNILLRPPQEDERSVAPLANIEKPRGLELSNEESLTPGEHQSRDEDVLPTELFQEDDRESIAEHLDLMQPPGNPLRRQVNSNNWTCCEEIMQAVHKHYLHYIQHMKKCKPNLLRTKECYAIFSVLKDSLKK